MDRHAFGGDLTGWAFTPNADDLAQLLRGSTITAWDSASGGTQYTDLAGDPDGASTVTAVASYTGAGGTAPGQIPRFWGPPGVWGMWLSADGGPRAYVVTTDLATHVPSLAAAAPRMRPVVPLYAYPSFAGSDWDTLAASPSPGGMVIANPDSGPGDEENSDYTREINAVRAAGMMVLGYVTTDSTGLGGATAGSRALSDVRADIDAWYDLYSVDGIFFDLTPTGIQAVAASYVDAICEYVHAKGAGQVAVINPGTYPLTGDFIAAADLACVWEGDFTDNTYTDFSVPGYASWVGQYPPTKYLHLVYGADTDADMRATLAHAQQLGVAFVYCSQTNSAWLALANYWEEHAAELALHRPALDPLDRRTHHGAVPSHQVAYDSARRGTATLNGATTVVVSTTAVTADSTIQLTIQSPGGTPGAPYVYTRTPGVSFGVRSQAGDTSVVGWTLVG